MCSKSKGIGSADLSALMYGKTRIIAALLHCASHRRDNARFQARLEAGASSNARSEFDLGAVVGGVCDLYEHLACTHDVSRDTEPGSNTVTDLDGLTVIMNKSELFKGAACVVFCI